MSDLKLQWIDGERDAAPKHPPNSGYPRGRDAGMGEWDTRRTCYRLLTYPAPRVGIWCVTCALCGAAVAITAYGQADDPRSVRLVCQGAYAGPGAPS